MYFKNLWLAIVALCNSKNAHEFILNLDRLGNAICAGHYKTTVSGRVGFFALTKKNPYWNLLQWIINQTFKPIDGRKHCLRAYQWERGKGLSYRRGSDIALGLLSILIILACLILAPIIYFIALLNGFFK